MIFEVEVLATFGLGQHSLTAFLVSRFSFGPVLFIFANRHKKGVFSHELVFIELVVFSRAFVGPGRPTHAWLPLRLLLKLTDFDQVSDKYHGCNSSADDANHEVYKVVEVRRGMLLLCHCDVQQLLSPIVQLSNLFGACLCHFRQFC